MLIFLEILNFLLFFIVLLSRIVDDSQKGCYLRKNRKKHSSDNTSCKTHTLYTQNHWKPQFFCDVSHEYVLYLRNRTPDFRK